MRKVWRVSTHSALALYAYSKWRIDPIGSTWKEYMQEPPFLLLIHNPSIPIICISNSNVHTISLEPCSVLPITQYHLHLFHTHSSSTFLLPTHVFQSVEVSILKEREYQELLYAIQVLSPFSSLIRFRTLFTIGTTLVGTSAAWASYFARTKHNQKLWSLRATIIM